MKIFKEKFLFIILQMIITLKDHIHSDISDRFLSLVFQGRTVMLSVVFRPSTPQVRWLNVKNI